MVLSDETRARYARHILLVEIGELGQARLMESSVALSRPSLTTSEYLARAGVRVDAEAHSEVAVIAVAELTTEPLLHASAEALAGSLAAVEAIKTVLGVGARFTSAPPLDGTGRER
ncbi:MAG: hypothetical protein IPK60_02625 [Sandaracinaceae bacterium]|nr:hypothetical protein [Sandaracinaceae bacterium]